MKKLLLISTAFAALIAPIVAAAKPLRRPVPVAAPVYAWTGFYVGGNVGYGWGDARTDIAGNGTSFFTPSFVPTEPVLPGTVVAFADSNTARLNGVIGGGQAGYNYQFSPEWVLGFEADIQGAGAAPSSTGAGAISPRSGIREKESGGSTSRPPQRVALLISIHWRGPARPRQRIKRVRQ